MEQPAFKAYVVPGGIMPQRKTDGAVGFDVYARAVVHPDQKDPENPNLRRTLYDLQSGADVADPSVRDFVEASGALRIQPGHRFLIAVGVVVEIDFPWYISLVPRSGLAVSGINLANTPGTIDPDYRGEAGALLYNLSTQNLWVTHGERIAQMIFHEATIPTLEPVRRYEDLTPSIRHTGGFGSTGRHG
jgi:dUTP pyrophosphatase